jgi:hypothetical protein
VARPSDNRTVVETEEYRDQLEKLGNRQLVDEALRALTWSLTVDAEVWPLVPGYKRLRVAFTDFIPSETGTKPGLRVFFEIRDAHYIDLFFIERDTPGA